MRRWGISLTVVLISSVACGQSEDYLNRPHGRRLPGSSERVGLWWASSGWKIGPDAEMPASRAEAMVIRTARNEAEAAQLTVRPAEALTKLVVEPTDLTAPGGKVIGAGNIEVLEVRYVHVTRPTDKSATAGYWPDPLPPLPGPLNLAAGRNQPFWIRVKAPRDATAGIYEGKVLLRADGFRAAVPLKVEVYDFALPDRMTCTTAFGFSPGNVFRYQNISDAQQKREVLEKYWASFSAHHVSPYDPAPLDHVRVTWPDVKPPQPQWQGGQPVTNEKHGGQRGLLIFDDCNDRNVDATYEPLVKIPAAGLRMRFWYRTAVPGQVFLVTLNHHDAAGEWIYGGNNDIGLEGNGHWQQFDRTIKEFPEGARSVQLRLRATAWTETGEHTGLVWFDDVSLSDAATGKELIEGGDFERPTLPAAERDKLKVKFDFAGWDKAMTRAIDRYHFNSFRLSIPGMGGGTFHARRDPELLGFAEDTPHYRALFADYCGQLQGHLRDKGWLDEAFVYWFDEPAPKDYAFVMNGFAKLKAAAPEVNRMLTEQVEPALVGGPNIWCPVSHHYKHEPAEQRRRHGEEFWWYVCTGPKAPYCTLFIDHPGTELRLWLWQTWQRNIKGILVWQSNYWTSPTAFPDPAHPQNPYEDPMGWRTGYSTPKGEKRPWGNGDGRFIYPPPAAADGRPSKPVLEGPVDSIRWEMLRDGIEDYEYMAMLQRLLKAKANKLSGTQRDNYARLLQVPTDITEDMTTFTKDPAPMEAHRGRVARAIEALTALP